MLRFINPNFKTATQQKIEQHKPAVDAWLKAPAQAGNRIITLAELRAGLPAIAAELSRQVVNQIMAELHVEIENPDDTAA